MMLIGPADDLEEQFGPRLGEGNISKLINHQQMESLELFVQPLKPFFFPALHQLGNQVHSRIEANASALAQAEKARAQTKWVLPVPGFPMKSTFSFLSRYSPRRSSRTKGATGAFPLFSMIFSEILISPDIGLDKAVSMSAINFFTRFWGKAVDNF
jgi:hypothetical protein